MRLVAQAKGGYYPAPPDVVKNACARLATNPGAVILDPCAGKGEAIGILAEHLGIPMKQVYAIELADNRAVELKERLPGANILAPCSAFGTAITNRSFDFIWCNPPFDDQVGGGLRVETKFLQRCTYLLRPGGVMFFVCPENTSTLHEVRHVFSLEYESICRFDFPAELRQFNEVVVCGVRRARQPKEDLMYYDYKGFKDPGVYTVRAGDPPKRFEKCEFTQDELIQALEDSPLNRYLMPAQPTPPVAPPLPLSTGHIALLLASGMLDGIVHPPGEEPHVVRGTATKEQFVKECETTEDDNGNETTKTVYSERIKLAVRVVTRDGQIRTFGE